jgi:hypothetical protein
VGQGNEDKTMRRRVALLQKSSVTILGLLAAIALCAMQFGDRSGLNNMPFSQVQPLVSDLGKAQALAKQGNIEFLGGELVSGQSVRVRGELTDANCYLGSHTHAYDHAFCAKFCIAAGSGLVFISDEQSKLYVVLTAKNGVRLPEEALDQIGVPGIVVKGKMLQAGSLPALAVEGIER